MPTIAPRCIELLSARADRRALTFIDGRWRVDWRESGQTLAHLAVAGFGGLLRARRGLVGLAIFSEGTQMLSGREGPDWNTTIWVQLDQTLFDARVTRFELLDLALVRRLRVVAPGARSEVWYRPDHRAELLHADAMAPEDADIARFVRWRTRHLPPSPERPRS